MRRLKGVGVSAVVSSVKAEILHQQQQSITVVRSRMKVSKLVIVFLPS